MIYHCMSAALLLRDGFTATPFRSGSAVLCRLDGRRIRPAWKPEGYLVLMDLEPGEHTLELSARGYQDERLTFTAADGGGIEREIYLKPGAGYRFPPDTARLRVRVSEKGAAVEDELWACAAGTTHLRLAQDKEREDPREVRLFCQGAASRLPVPGRFLVADGKGGELVHLLSLRDEEGLLEEPMQKKHPRSTELFPMVSFRTDAEGLAELMFPHGGDAYLYCRTKWKKLTLQPGGQELDWALDAK